MVHYTLHYFPVRGRCEFIRYLLAQAEVPYDEKLYTFDDWTEAKPKFEFGVVPVLEVDGKQLCQSMSIARYLADKYNLAGSTEWNKAWASMIAHCIEDIYPKGYRGLVIAVKSNDEKAKKEAWEQLKTAIVQGLYEKFEKLLGNKKYFCGDELTWADLYVAEFSERIESQFEKGYVSKFPNLHRHMQQVHELPNIKKYVKNRPPMPL